MYRVKFFQVLCVFLLAGCAQLYAHEAVASHAALSVSEDTLTGVVPVARTIDANWVVIRHNPFSGKNPLMVDFSETELVEEEIESFQKRTLKGPVIPVILIQLQTGMEDLSWHQASPNTYSHFCVPIDATIRYCVFRI